VQKVMADDGKRIEQVKRGYIEYLGELINRGQ
jgi:hypothetical protein